MNVGMFGSEPPYSVRILRDKARPGVEKGSDGTNDDARALDGTNDDARALWIDWNGKGERYKPWRSVCQESRQLEHAGFGLRGGGTALHMA